jgi:argininosuccinate lyase
LAGELSTLWHGRFAGGPSDELLAFTVSLPFDRRLAGDDIAGSRAHVRGLGRVGILDDAEVKAVLVALDQVEGELVDGTFAFAPSDEDIHTAVERRVTELAGPAGAKLHTGRSRNDQVATDLRLFAPPPPPRHRRRPPPPRPPRPPATPSPTTSPTSPSP